MGALDGLRRVALGLLGPLAKAVLVRREVRVATLGSLLMIAAFAATLGAPSWTLGVGTIVFGVPHVVSGVRYLVVRRGLHRRYGVLAMIAGGVATSALGLGLRGALLGAAGATVLGRARWPRKAVALSVILALLGVAQAGGLVADVVYAHAHNLVALGFFLAWSRGARPVVLLPLVVFSVGALFLVTPTALGVVTALGGFARAPRALDVFSLADQLAPLADPSLAARAVLLFVFAQAAHYVVWLRLVPELARPGATPRSYRQSGRALLSELGPWVLGLASIGALVFLAWAFVDLAAARIAYLQSAFFHGYVELAVAALWFCEGSAPEGSPVPR